MSGRRDSESRTPESAVYEIFANPASYEDVFSAATELQLMEFLDLRPCESAMKQWLDLKW